jgi:hypothetical protein
MNTASSLFHFEANTFSKKQGKERIGLLHRRTSVPAFLMYLEGIEKPFSIPLSSTNDIDSLITKKESSQDLKAWSFVRQFFESGGKRAFVCATPLNSSYPDHVLASMIGQDHSYILRSGIYSLKNAVDRADLVVIPQASILLSPHDYQAYCKNLCDWITTQRNLFLLLDLPKGFSIQEAIDWSSTLQCEDAALYYPWLIKDNEIVPSSSYIAAAFQRADEEIGFQENPTNRPIRAEVIPLMKLGVHQSTLLQKHRINSVLSFRDVSALIWGSKTLAFPTSSEFQYIATRRVIKNLSDAITSICDHYVLEPLQNSTIQILQNELDDFCSTHKNLFNDQTIKPYQISVAPTAKTFEPGILVDCSFHLKTCIESLNLSIGVNL